jgi:SAM-dependent methyltransferase
MMNERRTADQARAEEDRPPDWAVQYPKPFLQGAYDLLGAPFRMVLFPDQLAEKLHLTSLRGERFAIALDNMKGRCLDVGAGDNMLIKIYKDLHPADDSVASSVGTDVIDWGGDCVILKNSAKLPFDDNSFDTVSFLACINHIPERVESLREAYRVLKPDGRLMISMIGRVVGTVGHALWWYSEDKHRDIDEEEEMGMNPAEIYALLERTGFGKPVLKKFVYRMNYLYLSKPEK